MDNEIPITFRYSSTTRKYLKSPKGWTRIITMILAFVTFVASSMTYPTIGERVADGVKGYEPYYYSKLPNPVLKGVMVWYIDKEEFKYQSIKQELFEEVFFIFHLYWGHVGVNVFVVFFVALFLVIMVTIEEAPQTKILTRWVYLCLVGGLLLFAFLLGFFASTYLTCKIPLNVGERHWGIGEYKGKQHCYYGTREELEGYKTSKSLTREKYENIFPYPIEWIVFNVSVIINLVNLVIVFVSAVFFA